LILFACLFELASSKQAEKQLQVISKTRREAETRRDNKYMQQQKKHATLVSHNNIPE
jgi:glucose-6-phosphate 1-dehydrogenase